MAYATIEFKHPMSGGIKSAPVGFSWTTFFFGFFPALFRGHWPGFALMLAVWIFTGGIGCIVMAFLYNKLYIKHLIGDGYKVTGASQNLEMLAGKLNLSLPIHSLYQT